MMSRLVPVTVTGVCPLQERERKKTDYNKVKGTAQIVLTDGDIIYTLGEIFMPGHVHRLAVQHHDALDGSFFIFFLAFRS